MYSENKGKKLLEECKSLYGAKSIRELANMLGLPPTTLNGMKDNLSSVAELLLITLIENKKLQKSQRVIDSFVDMINEKLEDKSINEK